MARKKTARAQDGPKVIGANGKERRPRVDDAARVHCPQCSNKDQIVYCQAYTTHTKRALEKSTTPFTYYRCPRCDYHTTRQNYPVLRAMTRMGILRGTQPDFSSR